VFNTDELQCGAIFVGELTTSTIKTLERFPSIKRAKILKGLCHPRCMRKLMGSTLKSLAQLFPSVREFRRLLYRIGCKCKRIMTDFGNFFDILRKAILVVEIKQVYAGTLLSENHQPDSTAHVPQLTESFK